jgi:plasmid maintenance system antidote protein VapI
MSSYRKTMAEAMQEVNAISQERQDKNLLENVLMGTLKDNQLANLKKVWANKSMKDVTPGLKATIAKMDMPTKVAIAGAGINVLKDIVFKEEDAYDKDDEKPKTKPKPKPKKLQASYEEVELQAILDEKFTVQITKKDGSTMELGRYNTSHEAQRYVDMYGKGAKVVKEENFHEGKMSQIYAMDQDGASATEIAKALKVSTKTVEDILGEDKKDLDESFSPAMLQKLKTEFGPLKGKTINAAQARQLMNILDKLNDKGLETLKGAGIPFVSSGAMSKLSVRNMKFKVTTLNPMKEESCGCDCGKSPCTSCGKDHHKVEESYTVKYVDPLNKKNLRMKHADKKDAQDMMDRLKKDGVKEIEIVKEGSSAFSPTKKFSDQEIKQAYGIANDPRYKGGNYSGAVTAIEKIAKGLSSYPAVQNVLKRTNEDVPAGSHKMPDGTIMKDKDHKKEVEEDSDPCWDSHKMVGMKSKGGKQVPNCVPKEETQDGAKKLVAKIMKEKFGATKDLTEARWEIEGKLSYKGIGSYDNFHMVVDAPNKDKAEDKAYSELDKARARKKIGPGGGGRVEDAEVESIEKTNDKLSAPETYQGGN